MEDSIFTKIIKGEIPCHKVYEDDKTLAFLDIHGAVPGHTLVIPKLQVDHLWDLSDEDYQAVMTTTRKVANRLREVLKPLRVGLKVMGEEVPHAHIHLIPFNAISEYRNSPDGSVEPNHEALADMAKKLALT
jgi:histidine triad (HIT) family protein